MNHQDNQGITSLMLVAACQTKYDFGDNDKMLNTRLASEARIGQKEME